MKARRIPLSGKWWFSGTGTEVDLPHTILELPFNHFDEKTYQVDAAYKREFLTPEIPEGGALFVEFEGVAVACEVLVNGTSVGSHRGPYTPFSFNITKYVARFGEENELEVLVSAKEDPSIPPFGGVVDYLVYGGIYRAVWLRVSRSRYIERIHALPEYRGSGEGGLGVEVELGSTESGALSPPGALRLGAQLLRDGKVLAEVGRTVEKKGAVGAEESGGGLAGMGEEVERADFPELSGIEAWDIDSPSLYELRVTLFDGEENLDSLSCKIGFRSAEFREAGFFLNGRRVFLRGLDRHQSYPYMGYAMGPGAQREDARVLKKELGLTVVRASHYPQSSHFLDACDELGLLVFAELPGWQHIGDDAWQEAAAGDLRDLILRDRNHPSVVLWGTRINESQDSHDFYVQTGALAHYFDPFRQTGGVRYIKKSELLEDVYTFNDFSHYGGKTVIADPKKVVGGAPVEREEGSRRESLRPFGPWKLWSPLKRGRSGRGAVPRPPYLISEHTGHMFPAKRYDQEERLAEHAARHARVLDAAMGNPRISGAIGWCAFDYNTHEEFGSGDRVCYHGVSDMFRIPKYAAAVYSSQMDPREKIVLEPASIFARGERSAALMLPVYVYTNCDAVDLYRGGRRVGRFFPDKSEFPNLEHPPVVIDDLIGERIKAEGFSARDSSLFRKLAAEAMRVGADNLGSLDRLKFGLFLVRNKMKLRDVELLVQKYGMGWGSRGEKIELVGILNGKEAVRRVFGSDAAASKLVARPDAEILRMAAGDEWDCARVSIGLVDQYGNICPFAFEPVAVKLSGPGRILGPASFCLQGGVSAFWVATVGEVGQIEIEVESPRFVAESVKISVLMAQSGGGQ